MEMQTIQLVPTTERLYGAQWTSGQIDGALNFDGVDDRVEVNDAPDLDGMDAITLSAWVKTGETGNAMGVISKFVHSSGSSLDDSYSLRIQDNGMVQFQYTLSGGAYVLKLSSPGVADDTWHHVTGVYTGLKGSIYIDGNEVALSRDDHDPGGAVNETDEILHIGCVNKQGSLTQFFEGTIDDVRIYDRALSAEEVENLYRGELFGLEIVGPNEVAENFQAQYKAVAHYGIGSTKDVTDLADWSVEPNNNCSIEAGLLTAETINLPLDLTITAKYSEGDVNKIAQKQVEVFTICPTGIALEFDGVDDYVDCGNDSSLMLTNNLSLVFWFRSDSIPSARGGIVNTWKALNPSASGYGIQCYDGHIEAMRPVGSHWNTLVTTSSVTNGDWHHIGVVYDPSGTYLYVNGSLDVSNNVGSNINVPSKLMIGADIMGNKSVNGTIDDVRIYNKALSTEEIQVLMHTRPDTDDPNLVAYWDFDEGSGQVAGDSAGGNDGQLGDANTSDNSDPNWTDDIPPVGICTVEGIVERNLLDVLDMKNDVLDILDEAIGKEEALWEYMDTVFKNRDFGNTSKGDVVKAKQKIMGAIQCEEQAETDVDKSLEKLDDALSALGIDLDGEE